MAPWGNGFEYLLHKVACLRAGFLASAYDVVVYTLFFRSDMKRLKSLISYDDKDVFTLQNLEKYNVSYKLLIINIKIPV